MRDEVESFQEDISDGNVHVSNAASTEQNVLGHLLHGNYGRYESAVREVILPNNRYQGIPETIRDIVLERENAVTQSPQIQGINRL
jgi:hypothetical protein